MLLVRMGIAMTCPLEGCGGNLTEMHDDYEGYAYRCSTCREEWTEAEMGRAYAEIAEYESGLSDWLEAHSDVPEPAEEQVAA